MTLQPCIKYNIVLASSDDNEDHEVTVIHSLISKQVDGIIFMGHHLTEKNPCRILSYPYTDCSSRNS